MIEVRNLSKSYGELRALNSVSFTARDGAAFGLLGRNGAGKTTSIRIIMDIFKADAGEVLIDGKQLTRSRLRIGYLPEERGLYPKRKIIDQMVYIARLRGMPSRELVPRADAMLERMQATEYRNRKLDTLSKGNQQKIQLAIALLNDPDIVILDEPFSGLDPVNAQLLKDAVREEVDKGKTVIFSSHQMAQVEAFCDDICLLDRGKVALLGELKEIKKSYPRNTLEIEAEGLCAAELENMIRTAASGTDAGYSVKAAEGAGGILRLTLAHAGQREALLRTLLAKGISPSRFLVREPSLEEIFVEKLGDEPQEAAREEAPSGKRGLLGRLRRTAK